MIRCSLSTKVPVGSRAQANPAVGAGRSTFPRRYTKHSLKRKEEKTNQPTPSLQTKAAEGLYSFIFVGSNSFDPAPAYCALCRFCCSCNGRGCASGCGCEDQGEGWSKNIWKKPGIKDINRSFRIQATSPGDTWIGQFYQSQDSSSYLSGWPVWIRSDAVQARHILGARPQWLAAASQSGWIRRQFLADHHVTAQI